MKKQTYVINESKLELAENTVSTYGISCINNNQKCLEVRDISTDKNAIEKLVKLCNDLDLDPTQLMDIAEDFVI